MVLKEWSEAQKIYKETSSRLFKAIFVPWPLHKAQSYWYIWVIIIGFFLSALLFFVGTLTERVWAMALGLYLILLVMPVLWWFASTKALAKEFSGDYTTHGLAQYPFSARSRYLHYALFLHELVEQEYSHEDVAKLSSFADIVKPPELPGFRPFQSPGFMFFMGMFAGFFIKFITDSPGWKSAAPIFITICLQLVGISIVVVTVLHDVVNRPKYQHLTLQRFLQWAERDIDINEV